MPNSYITTCRLASSGPETRQGHQTPLPWYIGLSAAQMRIWSRLETSSILARPPYPLTRPPELYNTKTSVWLVDRCAWKAGTSCLRAVRYGLLRSYVQVITYMCTQLLWLRLLLRLFRSSLERLRPKPRTPEYRFCDSSNSQSAVYDYANCPCGSELLQVQRMASFSVRLVRAMRCSVRISSRHN